MINHNLADVHQPACAQAVHSLTPASSLIQTILSVSESHRIGRHRGSRTIPPVGNFALPRRNHGNYSVFIPINIRICGVIISPVHSITYKREFQYFFNNLSFRFSHLRHRRPGIQHTSGCHFAGQTLKRPRRLQNTVSHIHKRQGRIAGVQHRRRSGHHRRRH